jgi:formate-dependent nitrite reductase membrane component NrfD
MRIRLSAISFAIAAAAAVFLLVYPVYSGFDGERPTHSTLLRVNGAWVIVPVMFPVVVAMMPLLIRKQAARIVATVVMGAFVLISGFSIGMFYLPASVLMLLAACVEDSAKFRDVFR